MHGFPADDEQDFVTQHGSVRPRRVSGLTQCTSGYLVGTLHKCHKCKGERAQLQGAARKARHYYFRSYHPGMLQKYSEHPKFSFVALEFPLMLSHRHAVTQDLHTVATSYMSMVGGGNASSLHALISS